MHGLIQIALFMVLAYVLTNGFQVASNWIMAKVTQKALKNLRTDLFANLQQLSLSFYDRNPAGALMSRRRTTSTIDAINQAVSMNITSLMASVLTLVGILAAMFLLDFWLALASLVVVPFTLWFTHVHC